MKFELSEKEYQKFKEWEPGVLKRAMELQKSQKKEDDPFYNLCEFSWERGYAYYGAIGGEFTFKFTPTSVGTAVTVKEAITKEEINITDYNLW